MGEVIKFNMEATDFQIDSLSLFWHNYIKLFKDCTQPASRSSFQKYAGETPQFTAIIISGANPKILHALVQPH